MAQQRGPQRAEYNDTLEQVLQYLVLRIPRRGVRLQAPLLKLLEPDVNDVAVVRSGLDNESDANGFRGMLKADGCLPHLVVCASDAMPMRSRSGVLRSSRPVGPWRRE